MSIYLRKDAYVENLFRTLLQLIEKEADIRTIKVEALNIKKYLLSDLK